MSHKQEQKLEPWWPSRAWAAERFLDSKTYFATNFAQWFPWKFESRWAELVEKCTLLLCSSWAWIKKLWLWFAFRTNFVISDHRRKFLRFKNLERFVKLYWVKCQKHSEHFHCQQSQQTFADKLFNLTFLLVFPNLTALMDQLYDISTQMVNHKVIHQSGTTQLGLSPLSSLQEHSQHCWTCSRMFLFLNALENRLNAVVIRKLITFLIENPLQVSKLRLTTF